jgi:hypothetical protein
MRKNSNMSAVLVTHLIRAQSFIADIEKKNKEYVLRIIIGYYCIAFIIGHLTVLPTSYRGNL